MCSMNDFKITNKEKGLIMAGKKNSSQTRVYPAFTKIKNQMGDFINWLNERQSCNIPTSNVDWDAMIIHFADKQGKGEVALPPSASLLKWMVDNYGRSNRLNAMCSKGVSLKTVLLREKMFEHDPITVRMAYDLINSGHRKGWFALEGYTRPDVYIETNRFILLVEGKRTETNLTDHTTCFKNGRDQLIRHMDAVLDIALDRSIFGIVIYEEGATYELDLSDSKLIDSLPHRDASERKRIKSGWLTPITWQELEAKFRIGYPDVC